LIILNRWGKVVFEDSSYQNQWNGTNSKGNPLKSGTYYFFLSFDEGKEKNQGVLQIITN
jgi:gliding motility-associated-like protein